MKILWFPRLQLDIDKLHMTTWREVCGELETLGHSVSIAIAGGKDGRIASQNQIYVPILKIKYLRIGTFLINGFIKFILAWIRTKPNVIILDIFSVWFSIPFIFVPAERRPIIIVDNRTPFYNLNSQYSSLSDEVFKKYTAFVYQYSNFFLDGMTVITNFYKQYVCNVYKYSSERIGVWESGVDVNTFSLQKYRNEIRPHCYDGYFIIMQHGELSFNRGLLETIEAFSLLKQNNIILLLIGEGKAEKTIRKLITKKKLENRVLLLPTVPFSEIPRNISYCDCAIMAYPNLEYWNNNNPIKLIEYLSMGKVVISTDMWMFRSVMSDSKCAYYIKENRPEFIMQAIDFCYKNRELLNKWGEDGVEIVKERYTWRKQAEKLLSFINKLQNLSSMG